MSTFTDDQITVHWRGCGECYCSIGRAGALAHMQRIEQAQQNREAVEQEFKVQPVREPDTVRLVRSFFGFPIRRREEPERELTNV